MTSQLVGFQSQADDQDASFLIIMVNDDNNETAMHTYARSSNINFPMVRFDSKGNEQVAALIGNPADLPLPAVLVLAPDGEALTKELEEALEMVKTALGGE